MTASGYKQQRSSDVRNFRGLTPDFFIQKISRQKQRWGMGVGQRI